MPNCAIKADLKGATEVNTSHLGSKSNLAKLITEVDKIDIDKLKTVPVDSYKLINVVNNDVVKKTVYDKLVPKVNAIDVSGFVLKTQYDTDKSNLEKKTNGANNKFSNIKGIVKKRIMMLKSLK